MSEKLKTADKSSEKKSTHGVSRKPETTSSPSVNSFLEQILHLQQTIGNRGIQRLIKSGSLQAKLKIGHPDDKYEQEAERIADRVMRMTEPSCPECKEKEEEPELEKGFHVQQANLEIQFKKIKVGDKELPEKKDLNFTIATILGESSPVGPISEKTGIAMVLKRRVEEKWKGKSTFRDIILHTGVYGNPTGNALARLAELYLNDKPDNLEGFKKLVDKVKTLRKADRDYLKTKGGFKVFVKRIEQSEMAVDFVLAEAKFEPTLETISKQATWWGGEIDLWDVKTGKFRRHGLRVAKKQLVFVIYREIGETYFLKTAASIKDEKVREKEIKRSKKFLCDELERHTKWTKEEIKKNNPVCK
jgi:hypothetical protein